MLIPFGSAVWQGRCDRCNGYEEDLSAVKITYDDTTKIEYLCSGCIEEVEAIQESRT